MPTAAAAGCKNLSIQFVRADIFRSSLKKLTGSARQQSRKFAAICNRTSNRGGNHQARRERVRTPNRQSPINFFTQKNKRPNFYKPPRSFTPFIRFLFLSTR